MKRYMNDVFFTDGTVYDPPENPLIEKWKQKYPPKCKYYDDLSCAWCYKCPKGGYWDVPEEDKEEYERWQQDVMDYNNAHGGIGEIRIRMRIDTSD